MARQDALWEGLDEILADVQPNVGPYLQGTQHFRESTDSGRYAIFNSTLPHTRPQCNQVKE
jgi:hypothetical protein